MAWYDPAWPKRKALTINSSEVTGTHTNRHVLVTIDDAEILAGIKRDQTDVVFTDEDGETKLSHIIRPELIARPLMGTDLGDGIWTWFNDPRAVYDASTDRTFVSSVQKDGSAVIEQYDHATDTWSAFTLHSELEVDDHDNPGLCVLDSNGPNPGRVLACYSQHNGASYSRRSTNAGDISAWETEVDLGTTTASYAEIRQLTGDSHRVYWFFRSFDGGGGTYSHRFRVSSDGGDSWSEDKTLLLETGERPYVKWTNNGANRLDFTATTGHPNHVTNNIYHGYMLVTAGVRTYHKSDGTLVGDDSDMPFRPSDFTLVYDGTSTNAWIWDIRIIDGQPRIAFTTFPNPPNDHYYHVARFDGEDWSVEDVAPAGATDGLQDYLYAAEPFYSGGISLDPLHGDEVICSVRPRGGWQLQRFRKTGASWGYDRYLYHSRTQKIGRPYVVDGQPVGKPFRVLFWTGPDYTSFTDYETAIYGIDETPKLRAEVNVPAFSSSADATLYIYYGNAAASDQQDTESNVLGANVLESLDEVWLNPKDDITTLSLAGLQSLSVECWIVPELSGSNTKHGILSNWQPSSQTTANVLLRLNRTDGKLEGFLVEETNTTRGGTFSDLEATANNLQHVALTFDTSGGIAASLDGVESATTYPCGTLDAGAGAGIDVGKDRSGADYVGIIETVRFHSDRVSNDFWATQYAARTDPANFFILGDEEEYEEADETAPTLSGATGTATSDTTADLAVTTDEDNGTLYVVVTTSDTAPSKAQVKAGQDHNGSAAVFADSLAIDSTGEKNFSASGLSASTTYYAHFMHEDAAENQSDVVTSSGFTTEAPPDVTAPTLESADINTAGTTLTLTFDEAVTGHSGFTLAGEYGSLTATYSSGDGTTSLVFTLSRTVYQGETVTLNYTAGDVVDGAENALATIDDFAVTNSSTAGFNTNIFQSRMIRAL